MTFNKEFYKNQFEKLLKLKSRRKFFIKESTASFKIGKFRKKSTSGFELAKFVKESEQEAKDFWTITVCYYSMLYIAKSLILTKGYETDDHFATQIALGHLFVPEKLENEDLELLNNTLQILDEEYIDYFKDARKESSISRYSPSPSYTKRRVDEVFENARKFIAKVLLLLENPQI